MRVLLLLFILLGGFHAWAGVSVQVGEGVRYASAANGSSWHAQYPLNARLGYLLGRWTFQAEYSATRDAAEGSGVLRMQTSSTSTMLWVRRSLSFFHSLPDDPDAPPAAKPAGEEGEAVVDSSPWGFFVGAGAGIYQESTRIWFYDSAHDEYSEQRWLGGAEFGWWHPIVGPVTLELSAQAFRGEQMSPAFQFGFGARLGVAF